jgi:hypothetical protein
MKDKHITASFHQNFEIDYPLIPDILGIMPFRKHYYNFDRLLKKSGLFHQQRTDDNAFYFLYDGFDNASSKSPHVVIPVGRRLPAEMIELHLSMWILLVCI